jgi:hypothetical protein
MTRRAAGAGTTPVQNLASILCPTNVGYGQPDAEDGDGAVREHRHVHDA